jgi:methylated-DNA-protein-cysteine methyltransferase-like protein
LKNMQHPSELFEAILRTIESIPEGCVASYGQIADRVGTGPRQVAQALRSVPEGRKAPWFRVINSAGKISDHGSYDRQHTLLEAEGVTFENGRVDFGVYGWITEDE